MSSPSDTPALLTTSKFLGTLATARCLAEHGVPVVVATNTLLGPAQWSRAASHVVRGRRKSDPESTLAWLLELAPGAPGAVLHPTSDEIAWILARHADRLSRSYRLYAPPFSAVRELLDKSRLDAAAARAGLRTPRAWYPRDEAEAARIAPEGLVVVKPRTQVFYASHVKGEIVSGADAVARAWRTCHVSPHAPGVVADAPGVEKPMVQELVPSDGVYSISGFVTRAHELLAARGARKVLQRPSGVGVGVCFEEAPVVPALRDGLVTLAREVGFFGAFEAEFVGERLIDFNPRYYGQMAFDVARGAPLPWLLHLGALGEEERLGREPVEPPRDAPRAYRDRVTLEVMLGARRLAGTLPPDAARTWSDWARARDGALVDATLARGDALPAVAFGLSTLWDAARHPRAFWRSLHGPL